MKKRKQKEPLSLRVAKITLAIVITTGLGTIIVGGGVVIMKYYNGKINKRIAKTVDQETENYYDTLGKRCTGDSCCLSSLKYMKENNYKEADKNYKCPDGFEAGGLRCESSLQWCEPIEMICDNESPWLCNRNCLVDSDCKVSHCGCINKKANFRYDESEKLKLFLEYITEVGCKCKNNKCGPFFGFPTAVEVKSNISDWQTYQNEEFGFEVKYPREWNLISKSDNDGLILIKNSVNEGDGWLARYKL